MWLQINRLKKYHDIGKCAQPEILTQHCLHGPGWNVTVNSWNYVTNVDCGEKVYMI